MFFFSDGKVREETTSEWTLGVALFSHEKNAFGAYFPKNEERFWFAKIVQQIRFF